MCAAHWAILTVGLSSSSGGRQESVLSILNRVMPGGAEGGGDLDLILDNDTIQPQMPKSGATFPLGSRMGGGGGR